MRNSKIVFFCDLLSGIVIRPLWWDSNEAHKNITKTIDLLLSLTFSWLFGLSGSRFRIFVPIVHCGWWLLGIWRLHFVKELLGLPHSINRLLQDWLGSSADMAVDVTTICWLRSKLHLLLSSCCAAGPYRHKSLKGIVYSVKRERSWDSHALTYERIKWNLRLKNNQFFWVLGTKVAAFIFWWAAFHQLGVGKIMQHRVTGSSTVMVSHVINTKSPTCEAILSLILVFDILIG